MLKKIDSPDTVLAVEVVGKLEKEDYQTVLVPGLRALLDGPGEIRCVFVFADEYTGLTVGGTVEDSKLYLAELVHRELSKWRRCAVVTSHDWLRHAISMFRFMMPGEVECFEPSQVQAAIDWAAAA
jgi:SpoIIAA-like